jgi:lipopolysaccharide/colanic/teichoic acid biosynthesis glycosyltransferase
MRHDSGNQKRQERAARKIERAQYASASVLSLVDRALKRTIDVAFAATLLVLASPAIAVLALAIKLDSPGPVFYRCLRVGRGGRVLHMLKFRKMRDDASGPALTAPDDARFTRLGQFLARTKLDELPQLWNVLTGEMSLVGPRPEDPAFVELNQNAYSMILEVRPGITGLSQLAFASESDVLDPDDRLGHYVGRILPQKIGMDQLYASRRSLGMDLKILWWTLRAVVGGRDVAVHRETGRLTRRAPRAIELPERRSALVLERRAS